LSVGELPDRQKGLCSNKSSWLKALEFMENRYLPILHENISLSVLCVSNESLSPWGEWAVKIVLNGYYFVLMGRLGHSQSQYGMMTSLTDYE